MKCDANCLGGEDASIFFSYIEDGKIRKVNLCKHCAQEKGINDPAGYALLDMLEGMGEENSTAKKLVNANELTCPACGFTQSDFKKTGRFGCAECYGVFTEGLETLIEAMHKKTVHIGKAPGRLHGKANSPAAAAEAMPAAPPVPLPPPLPGVDLPLFDEIILPVAPSASEADPDVSLAILRDKLDIAISSEDYEEAARIRDAIARLEKKENPGER